MDVGAWLKRLGLERYEAAFRENDVDGDVLPTLTADDLKDLGITSVGHRRCLLDAIVVLRSERMPAEAPAGVSPGSLIEPTQRPEVSGTVAERRPLCVMFC